MMSNPMKGRTLRLAVASALAIALSVLPASAQKKYDIGATDTEIKVGQAVPFSGPVSAYATIGKAQAAYMKMVNDRGGVNGRKINLIQYDDAYSPPKTVEQVRKLVESDEVLLTFQLIGTPPNAAVQKYLNAKKVPQLFVATGASRLQRSEELSLDHRLQPQLLRRRNIYGRYILKNHPDARIGVLYQNDDVGKEYLRGLNPASGARPPG